MNSKLKVDTLTSRPINWQTQNAQNNLTICNAFLLNVKFASHPSIRIVKKIIFVNTIIIANGTGKDRQYVLNNMLLIL